MDISKLRKETKKQLDTNRMATHLNIMGYKEIKLGEIKLNEHSIMIEKYTLEPKSEKVKTKVFNKYTKEYDEIYPTYIDKERKVYIVGYDFI